VPSNCLTFKLDLSCSSCAQNYSLQLDGTCKSTDCLTTGFVFIGGACVPANCQVYDSNGCQVCLPNYVPEGRGCVPGGCTKYDSLFRCLNCTLGYTLSVVNGQALCVLTVPPTCSSGYYFLNNSCVTIPVPNCSVADPSGLTCYRCLNGFFLIGNVCYWPDGCLWPSYITGCRSCLSGYYLEGFLCISLNCLTIFPNNTCSSCSAAYNLVAGACRRPIYKCVSSDSQGRCLACADKFTLTQGVCIATNCKSYSPTTYLCFECLPDYLPNSTDESCDKKIELPNCYQVLNNTYCQQCNLGYVQLNGRCFPQVPWCLNYLNSTGTCSLCQSGYYPTQQGQCNPLPAYCQNASSSGTCLGCVQGYRLVSGQCLPNIPNCQSFNPNTGACTQCVSQYFLTAQGQCQPLPAFCTGADPTGVCTGCIGGYTVVAGACVVAIPNCRIYNFNKPSECYQCVDSYYLNANYYCSPLPPFCSYANSLGACISCLPNY
jgi:hypothetical protein